MILVASSPPGGIVSSVDQDSAEREAPPAPGHAASPGTCRAGRPERDLAL